MGIDLSLVWDAALAEVTDAAAGSLLSLDGAPVLGGARDRGGPRAREVPRARRGVTGSGAVAALTLRGLKPGSGALAIESLTLLARRAARERPAAPAAGRLVVAP